VVVDRVTEEQEMPTPVDDVLSADTESNENQEHYCSGSTNMVSNTDIDMLTTVVSREHAKDGVVIFSEGTAGLQENEFKIISEMEPAQVITQKDSSMTRAAGMPLVDSELSVCNDAEPKTDSAHQQCFFLSVSGSVLSQADENCVAEFAEVEIQHDKSDVISTHEERDDDCIIQGVSRNEEFHFKEAGGMQEDEVKVTLERESVQVVEQCDCCKTSAGARPLADSELAACSDTGMKTSSAWWERLSIDVLPTAGSHEPIDDRIVIFNKETGDVQEYEVKVTSETDSDSDCVILDESRSEEFDCEETGGIQENEIKITSKTESTQVVKQHVSSETHAPGVPLVDSELSTCSDAVPKTDGAQPEYLSGPGAVLRPLNEICVAEDAEMDIQLDKSDTISTIEDCVIQGVSRSEELVCCPTNTVDEMVVDLLDDDDEDDMPMTNSEHQEHMSVSDAAVWPESQSCVTGVAEVEIHHKESDTILTHEDTDSDCIIQGVSRSEEWDFWPNENGSEMMNIDLLRDDHAYCHSSESVHSRTLMTSSNGICPNYTSQTGISFSVPSVRTSVVQMATVLPFPSLITEPNPDELCPYSQFPSSENTAADAAIFRVSHNELMDTEVSRPSGLGGENRCTMMVDSSYPVLEIVPCCDGDEVNVLEQSDLSSQEPCSTASAHVSGSSNVADVHGDIAASSNMAATNHSSRRAKVSAFGIIVCNYTYREPLNYGSFC